MNPLTQQGAAALNAGNRAEARRLLKQALQQDSKDIQAWLYLSEAVNGDADIAYCLNMVLRLDPNNAIARQGMARFSQAGRSSMSDPSTPLEPPSQPDFRAELLQNAPFTTNLEEETPPPATTTLLEKTTGEGQRTPRGMAGHTSTQPAARKKARRKAKKTGFQPWMWATLGGMALLIFMSLIALITLMVNQPQSALVARVDAANLSLLALSSTPTRGLPPTSTPTASPTPRPTRTPTPTATYMALGPTIVKQMANIQQEVSDLRGLPIQSEVPGFLVNRIQAADLLRNLYINDATRAELENEKRSLVILGLVKPTYDLVNIALNQMVDNIGGFYLPDYKQMYILAALRFGGIEHTVYSHEFDHAIVDQAYDIKKMQDCPGDAQRCQAIKALIEGDATLLMNKWVKQYATPADYRDFQNYRPPVMALPEQSPPAYLIDEMNFPYDQGLKFVTYLYKRGNWAGVNRAYDNLPSSTEQILHPEKYIAGEGPIPVFAPAVENALGGDWQIIANSTLGEWTTYLLLVSGADDAAQIDPAVAAKAAAGWGGDHYQVYYSPSLDQSSLAVWWAWDTEKDCLGFNEALKKHLNELYRGNSLEQSGADCWEINNQATCSIVRSSQILWLTAPDLPTIQTMWGAYADFQ